LAVVLGFELGVAVLELFDERAQGLGTGDVSASAKVAAETLAENGDLFGQPVSALVGIG
jgi:hypothetical protein